MNEEVKKALEYRFGEKFIKVEQRHQGISYVTNFHI